MSGPAVEQGDRRVVAVAGAPARTSGTSRTLRLRPCAASFARLHVDPDAARSAASIVSRKSACSPRRHSITGRPGRLKTARGVTASVPSQQPQRPASPPQVQAQVIDHRASLN